MMNIRFAEDSDLDAVARFNQRLKAGGREEEMPLDPALPGEAQFRPEGFPLYRRLIIAEDGQEVRAAMLLCHHNVFLHGARHDFYWTKMPLSEGIVNAKYSLAIIQLMKKALQLHPFMMGVGAGTPDSDGYRLFVNLRWRYQSVPFFFFPVKVSKVLRDLRYLQKNAKLRYGALLGAYSGGGAAVSGILALRRKFLANLSGCEASVTAGFDDWADRVFANALAEYPVAIRSDATALNIVYPPDDQRYVRLRVKRKGTKTEMGWIVVARKQMRDNHYFGNLRVGTLVDGFGRAEEVPTLIAAGLHHLVESGADIVVANFSHAAWTQACRRSGMFSGPSNYQIFVSPQGPLMLEAACPLDQLHITRGHSDGMDNLI
jgi:hypothetical protein